MIEQYYKLTDTCMMLGKASGELHYLRKVRTLYALILTLENKVVAC